jgi:glutamate-1-semialdehyde 2,1-aminomutase
MRSEVAVPAHADHEVVSRAGDGAPAEGLEELLAAHTATYAGARPRSRALFERATRYLPGGNSRTQLYFSPFPVYIVRGEGAVITDADGIDYLDVLNNYTSLIHGHPTPDVVAAVQRRVAEGPAFGAPSPLEVELAEVLCNRIPSLERVRFTNSGTEACMMAVRTARAYTGRDDIIKAEGGYHGSADLLQVSVKHLGRAGESVPELGVPDHTAGHTHVIPFNDADAAAEIVRRVGSRAAALIVEPMQGSAGALPATPEYLRALRDVTAETGCLLIFDEVMTFRLAHGGAQEHYGVAPDLTTTGKIIGGGFPIGAFGGRADVMDVLDPRRDGALGHHGTFNANPASLTAGLIALERFPRERVDQLNARGDRLRDLVNRLADERGWPVVATGLGSLVQIHVGRRAPRSFRDVAGRPTLPLDCLFFSLLLRGIYVAPRGMLVLSTPIGDEEQERIEAALVASMDELDAAGLAAWADAMLPDIVDEEAP